MCPAGITKIDSTTVFWSAEWRMNVCTSKYFDSRLKVIAAATLSRSDTYVQHAEQSPKAEIRALSPSDSSCGLNAMRYEVRGDTGKEG